MLGFTVLVCLAGVASAAPSANSLVERAPAANKIVIANDDGWATAQIRAQFNALTAAGYNTILSAPAENQSGTGSSSTTPTVRKDPCEFNSCPAGSPAIGSDPSNPRLNYVNAYPVDGALYGINTLGPKIFGSKPDLVVSGPNIGNNFNLAAFFSGTIGAASAAALAGVPAVAFSAASGGQVSFNILNDPTAPEAQAAKLYSALTVKFLDTLLASSGPILPAGTAISVNYPALSNACNSVDSFKFVLTRLYWNPLRTDVTTCGSSHLPDEMTVVNNNGRCQISVSAINPSTKLDASAEAQAAVLKRLSPILTCAA
ncbi:SurE domain-containing protein [Mycena indigotica]|uniref:SurE domain-containing protein n=1 Tax=Mycena indigotica TaxID=2126181 RepID=A0A8H6W2R2_9AGAR|nr:SurE domain-containing protein [Mycena indigotica]KAF7297219.1 SurE domain-containing protein [Mycena indigotica]